MKYLVKLALSLLSIIQKIEKARHLVIMMTGNANFASPTPTPAQVTTTTNQLEALLLKAKDGTKSDTAAMRAKERELDILIKQLSTYVEGVANANQTTAEAVILSSGFDLRKKASRNTPELSGKTTGIPGEIKLHRLAVHRGSIEFQMCTDLTNPDWKTINRGTRGIILVTGLPAEAWYYFRSRTITADGTSEWSDVVAVYLIK
ncbi:MAG: hypothetical protein JSS79_18190 [Bacteroidetes bacterium]|nr:hypothetical protein [Bacteroidota bacterium]